MKIKIKTPFLFAALAAASISSASAATLTTLAFYDGVGTTSAQTLSSHDADLNSVASSLSMPSSNFTATPIFSNSSVGIDYTTVANSTYWNGTIGLTGDSDAVFESAPFFSSGSTAAAFADGDFFSFTVTANTNYEMTPDRLGFWFSADDAGSAEFWEARYSINGGGSFSSLGNGSVATGQGTNLSFIDLDVTGIGTLTDAQTLRIDIGYAGASANDQDFRGQDIVLTGTTVPEPSAAALLSLVGFGLLLRRRRN